MPSKRKLSPAQIHLGEERRNLKKGLLILDAEAEKAMRAAFLLNSCRNLGIVALAGSNTVNFLSGFSHSIERSSKYEVEDPEMRQIYFMKAEGTVQGDNNYDPRTVAGILKDLDTLQKDYGPKGVVVISGFDFSEKSSIGNLEIHERIFEIMEKNGSARSKPEVPAVLLVGPGNFTHLPSHPNFHRYPIGAEQPLGALAFVRQALDADGNLATAAGINEYQATAGEAFAALARQWNT